MTDIVVLGNRNAGRGRANKALPELLDALRRAGHGLRVIDEPDAARARRALQTMTDAQAIIACGGDGTVHVALQFALQHRLPMGIVPAGSGDDIARAIGLPHGRRQRDVRRAIRHCVDALGTHRPVDVVWATTADNRREAFLGVLAAGFDSRVNERANRITFPRGTARYIWAMLRELRNFTPIDYHVDLGETSLAMRGMLVAVGNGSTYGGGMRVCPGADVRDGMAEVLIVGALPRLKFLALFPKVFSGAHVHHPVTHVVSAPSLVLTAPGQTAWADGEYLGPTPVQLSVKPLAVEIIGAP